MNIGFDRIVPTLGYPAGTTAAALVGLTWESRAKVAIEFRAGLKIALRTAQLGRCCFCRRHLYDDYATHLEHFVDKATFPQFAYEIRNLALSCGTCNIRKNAYFLSWNRRYRFMTRTFVGPAPARCPVLSIALTSGDAFPVAPANFSWVNPHFHNYSQHILLVRGWVFEGQSPEGRRTIRSLKLNDVGQIERRALAERLEARGGALSMLVGAISVLDQHRANDVKDAIIKVLRRRREAAKASTEN
ncbi:HNH endonuclease [Cupriavidus nantongensis]|uniref:HNH endonuclease n=1 Tax=Cupriavidus nantongensis TaxID=1796606 RepID=UPI000A63BE41|nr:HNH endonuclease [Cupriavidus nantongensis]